MIQFLLCKMMYGLGMLTGLAFIVAIIAIAFGIMYNIVLIAILPIRLLAFGIDNNDKDK